MHQGRDFSFFCLALTAAGIVALAADRAAAVPAFREQFRAKYIKPDSKDPKDIALRDAFDRSGCNLCHVGEDRANRNAYGRALAKFVSRKTDTRNKEKIQAALDKIAAMKTKPDDPHSPSFGDIIASGKLPTDEATVQPTVQAAVRAEPSHPAAAVAFNRDIRPILIETCFRCHGPDSAARKAGLRLDQREAAMKAGVLAPGKPDESEVLRRVFSTDASEVMPPRAAHKDLTAAQKERLRQWIAAGAVYEPLWSFIPPVRSQPPAVKNPAWARNAIDHFILATLEQRGLQPAPEADRRTLARRLSLDLTGLPPSPAEIEAFVADRAPDAYEKLVERFLQSEHWGEHRARYWLDAARYADSHGIHFDNYREMWTYRDWVIGAFNRNLPFDRFTVEQLAGDLLPTPTPEQQIATGFNRCNITTNEGGAIAEEYLVLYTRDRTETTARVWLGLTAGCAVCHDHKFDPLSQREFYQMAAFFNNTTQAAMDGNVKDTPPGVFVPPAKDRDRWSALGKELVDAKQAAEARKTAARGDFDRWLATGAAKSLAATVPGEGLRLHVPLSEGQGDVVRAVLDGQPRTFKPTAEIAWDPGHVAKESFTPRARVTLEIAEAGDFDDRQPFSYGVWARLSQPGPTGALVARMDDQHAFRGWDLWLENGHLATHLIHQWPNDALQVVSNAAIAPGGWHHLLATYDGSRLAAGVKIYVDGQLQPTGVAVQTLKNTIRTGVPLSIAQRHTSSRLENVALQDLRIYGRALPAAEVERLVRSTRAVWLAGKPAGERTDAEKQELFDWWLPALDRPYAEFTARAGALEQEQARLKSQGSMALVMQERSEAPTAYVLFRGEYDKRRDAVSPATPAFLPPMPADAPKNRLGFARWLLRADHPLTARVAVNRFWQEIFGTGLVRTAEDFGVNGEFPSHAELLDWLAVEFRESGWDVKKLFRLLVTSAAYRQSAVLTPEKLQQDPQNRLVSRGPRFRMDAEMVRDCALAASGLLAAKIGGPSVRPYQPDGVWEAVAMIGSDTRNYRRDGGESLYRRSLYTFWKRAAPPASMDILGAPSREVCTVRRERTNTPLQALVTLNDPQFVEAARHLAERALKEGGQTAEERLTLMARRLAARPFGPEESRVALAALDDLLRYYKAHPAEAQKLLAVGESKPDPALDVPLLAAWTMLANQLMNLDEVLNK
jgi:hypothetical protein